jgi:hypothetical protein
MLAKRSPANRVKHPENAAYISKRPFRKPYHRISDAALSNDTAYLTH